MSCDLEPLCVPEIDAAKKAFPASRRRSRLRLVSWRKPLNCAELDLSLPPPLAAIIDRVLDKTRLWDREKEDVARELAAHFAEGLDAGRTVSELTAAFGSPETAAKLIRRAKIRNRPWIWHATRRTLQGAAVFVVAWGALVAAYFSGAPKVSRDFVLEEDTQTRKIPSTDRAWPLYREGLLKLDRKIWESVAPPQKEIDAAFLKGPEHPQWPLVAKWVDENRPALDLFLQGSARKQLGYIYRDPTNDTWLQKAAHSRPSAALYPAGTVEWERLLPHMQELHMAHHLLSAAARQAVDMNQADQAVRCWTARLNLAEQVWRAPRYPILDVIVCANVRGVCTEILKTLDERGDLLSKTELTVLARRVREVCDGEPRIRWDGLRIFIEDFLQHVYTDDGKGNGRFTPEGMKLIDALRKNEPPEVGELIGPDSFVENDGVLLSTVVADRREMKAKMTELLDHLLAEHKKPQWQQDPSRWTQELTALRDRPELRRKFFPALVLLAGMSAHNTADHRDSWAGLPAALTRDAALVMMAVATHRRDTGRPPERLEQLVPRYLSSVPPDPFDGQPLRYRIVNTVPTLYSIGRNRKDDKGTPGPKGENGWNAETGDWILFPTLFDE